MGIIRSILCIIYVAKSCEQDCGHCTTDSQLKIRSREYKWQFVRVAAILEIILGILLIGFGIWALLLDAPLAFLAVPIWGGALSVIIGILGILSKTKSTTTIMVYKWMSFLLIMVAITEIIAGFIAAFSYPTECDYFDDEYECKSRTLYVAVNATCGSLSVILMGAAIYGYYQAYQGISPSGSFTIEYDGPWEEVPNKLPKGLAIGQPGVVTNQPALNPGVMPPPGFTTIQQQQGFAEPTPSFDYRKF